MKLIKLSVFLFLSVFILSCSNITASFNSDEIYTSPSVVNGARTFIGNITSEGAFPEEAFTGFSNSSDKTKNAVYSVGNQSVLNIVVFAVNKTDPSRIITGELTPSKMKFSINLEDGEWTIFAGALPDGETALNEANLFLVDKTEITIDSTTESLNHEFVLRPKSDGYGTVDLEMTMPSSGGINEVKSVTAECISSNKDVWAGTTGGNIQPVCTLSGNTVRLSSTKLKSGVYTVQLKFYNSTDLDAKLVYATIQQITVCDKLTTSKWISNSETGPIQNGRFNLTYALATSFELRDIYVVSDEVVWDNTPSDGNSGTWLHPVKTLEKALSLRNENTLTGEGDEGITIYIAGEVLSGSGTLQLTKSTNIKGITAYRSDATPVKAKIKNTPESHSDCFLKISDGTTSKITVNINDLIYDGSYGTGDNPHKTKGILNSEILSLTNCEILNCENTYGSNESGYDGGGIYNDTGASLTLNKTKISGCSATVKGDGGGIYNKGTVELIESTIADCKATGSNSHGGAIYNAGSCRFDIDEKSVIGNADVSVHATDTACSNSAQYGGAIYNQGILKNEGKICYNYASVYGGCIYCSSGEFTQADGQISYNAAGTRGGGIYNFSDNCTVSGGVISGNYATNGGGIYNDYNSSNPPAPKTLTFSGGVIKDNEVASNNNGDGIFQSGYLKISGTAYVDPSDSVYLNKLSNNNLVQIEITSSSLDPKDDNGVSKPKFATVKPIAYTVDTAVVIGTGSTKSENLGKFSLADHNYFIDTTGKISTAKVTDFTNYASIKDIINTIPKSSEPYEIKLDLKSSPSFSNVDFNSILNGKSVKLINDTTNSLTFTVISTININNGQSVELKGITFESKTGSNISNLINVKSGGSLKLTGGTINNSSEDSQSGDFDENNTYNAIYSNDAKLDISDVTNISCPYGNGIKIIGGNANISNVKISNFGTTSQMKRNLEFSGLYFEVKKATDTLIINHVEICNGIGHGMKLYQSSNSSISCEYAKITNCKIYGNTQKVAGGYTTTFRGAGIYFAYFQNIILFTNNYICNNKQMGGSSDSFYGAGVCVRYCSVPDNGTNQIYDNYVSGSNVTINGKQLYVEHGSFGNLGNGSYNDNINK